MWKCFVNNYLAQQFNKVSTTSLTFKVRNPKEKKEKNRKTSETCQMAPEVLTELKSPQS